MEESRLNRGEVLSGIVLAAIGAFIIIEARGWEYLGAEGPGPGFFPVWYGVAMVALSLLLIGSNFLPQASAEARRSVNWGQVSRALIAWGALAVSIALLKVLGFLLSFALLTLFVVVVMYRRPLATGLAIAIGSAAGFYLVFPLALNVTLPVGVLGF